MKNKLFVYIRKTFLTQKVITFFICVVIASFLWLINSLNRNYNLKIQIPVNYYNLPKDKFLSNTLPSFIQAEIRTSGAKYLFLNYQKKIDPLEIDVMNNLRNDKNKNQYALNTDALVGNLSKSLNTEVELIEVKPDSIYFNFGKAGKKIVPVKANLSINFDPLYNYNDKIKITPSFITLYGDSFNLLKIDSISTEKIVLNKLNQNINQKTKLILPKELEGKTSLSSDQVLIEVQVDKLTEASLMIPVQLVNVPLDQQIKIFPDKIKVKFSIGMSDFEKVLSDQFSLIADFKNYKSGSSQLKVELKKSPPNVKILNMSHQKIEFIIRKKK